jgi:hypothetical protein
MAPDYVAVGEAADELTEDLGEPVRRRWITDLFYQGELRDDLCPVIAGRRLIPRSYLLMVVKALRRRGWINREASAWKPSLTAKECDLCGDVPVTHHHVECEYGTRDLCDSCYDKHVGGAD